MIFFTEAIPLPPSRGLRGPSGPCLDAAAADAFSQASAAAVAR
ncbi:hypothetical protein NY78_2059 [Desulfovibrio sp. TomC]|nr:hypothetical protein NY78_2059 [Desulfovibrio sp. TomC]